MECVANYRSKIPDSSDSDSSDSDNDFWKRSRSKNSPVVVENSPKETTPLSPPPQQFASASNSTDDGKKRKINKVWTSVIEEQTVTDVLGQCGLARKPISFQDRNCESYDFRRKILDTRGNDDPVSDEMDTDDEPVVDNQGDGTSLCRVSKKKFIRLKVQDIAVAKKITWKLSEKKAYLIRRIVHVIGADKAMELLKMTEDIEEEGGMLIKNNARRRTPGGVYIQLLKSAKNITDEQKEEIFAEEESTFLLSKKRSKKKKKKKSRKGKKSTEKTESMDVADVPPTVGSVPPLPESEIEASTVDTTFSEIDNSEIEDGEILD